MSAIDKTEALDRTMVPLGDLIPQEDNPNEMSDREFDLLCDNIERTGFTDPVLVRPVGDGKFRIIGGHWRAKAAGVLGFEQVPVTIITDPEFEDDDETFQVVRMNVIRGRMSPDKFLALYDRVKGRYQDDVLQELFGFADQAQFKKLIQETAAALPPEFKKEFEAAAKEIKTVEDLATILNRIMARGGADLDFGFLIFDFEGRESVWLRLLKGQLEDFRTLSTRCKEIKVPIDYAVAALFKMGTENEARFLELLEGAPTVETDLEGDLTLEALDGSFHTSPSDGEEAPEEEAQPDDQ